MSVLYPPLEGGSGAIGPGAGAGPTKQSGTPAHGRTAGGRSRVKTAFPGSTRDEHTGVRWRTAGQRHDAPQRRRWRARRARPTVISPTILAATPVRVG